MLYSWRYFVFTIAALLSLPLVKLLKPGLPAEKQKGVCWVAGHEPLKPEHFDRLVNNHVTWISQTPFGWQANPGSDSIAFITEASDNGNRGVMWGESDEGITHTTRLAREQGIKTILKPHLWVRQSWPGEIEMADEEGWKNWFAAYERFILHHAALAEASKIEMLCIGTELSKTIHREKEWRHLITQIRKIYHGKLTYGANFNEEFLNIRFWDALDYIGIQAYFPLAEADNASLKTITNSWHQHMAAIVKVVDKFQKPVLFTELGYRSTACAAVKPWLWPQQIKESAVPSEEMQARCYQAFFDTVWRQKWLAGVYFWKWYPNGTHRWADIDFTPQGKEAEKVMAGNYLTDEKRH